MTSTLKILAITSTNKTAEDIKAILAGVSGLKLDVVRSNGHSPLEDADDDLDAVLFELVDVSEAALQSLAIMMSGGRSRAALVVIGPVDNPDTLRRLMRMGARDVLPSPVMQQDLLGVVGDLRQEKQKEMSRGETANKSVIAFFNARGGCGSTTIAVNAAASLAARHQAKVALIDFDIQFGKAALLLDLKPQKNVLDALRESERLDPVLFKALMTVHKTGLHVLAAPSALGAVKEAQASSVRRLIETAASSYDVVILDLPHYVTSWTLEALRAANKVLIVTQNTLSAIRDTRQLLDFLSAQKVSLQNVEVVNNRALSKSPSVTVEQMKEALRRERLHRIRNDYAAAISAEDRGQPITKASPQSPMCEDIDGLADYLWVGHHGEDASSPHVSWLDKLGWHRPRAALPKN